MAVSTASPRPGQSKFATETYKRTEKDTPSRQCGRVLWFGWGDLAKKSAPALKAMKDKGYEIYAVDMSKTPKGLEAIEPHSLLDRASPTEHSLLRDLGRKGGFDFIYVGNLANQHIGTAIELQHWAPKVVLAKPLDTNLSFLRTMIRDRANYGHLLNQTFVHDHYLNKPGVVYLKNIMQQLHAEHNFIDRMQLYLVERDSIEHKEPHRLKGLECGMLFDLAVHLISIMQVLIPKRLKWNDDFGSYERVERSINVRACHTAKDGASLLQGSSVMENREAETFGVLELVVTETVRYRGTEVTRDIPVLIVVGKGVPSELGATRDLKTVIVKFRDEAEIGLDLDTYQPRGVDDAMLRDTGFSTIQFDQKGINMPLIEALDRRFEFSSEEIFQSYVPGFEAVSILSDALNRAPQRPIGYGRNATVRGLVNLLLQKDHGFSPHHHWNLPDNFQNFLIGNPGAPTNYIP